MISFKSLYNAYAQHPQGSWILKPDSAITLYRFIKKNDVKNVLELGTGIGLSTAVISLAIKEKSGPGPSVGYKIVTVEQFEKCHKLAQELMPPELKELVDFKLSETTLWEHPDIAATQLANFKELPEQPEGGWDLIVVDGPGPYLDEKGRLVESPNGDVLRLISEGKLKAGTKVYFDGRLAALGLIERFYGDNFFLLEDASRRNVIERKDNELKFDDYRIKTYTRSGYFN